MLERKIMKNDPEMDSIYLWTILHQARDAIFRLREKELRKLGISTAIAEVMFTIENIGSEATPTKISRHLLREFHSVSSILSRMEKKGLVKKVNDLKRKNIVRVYLKIKAVRSMTRRRRGSPFSIYCPACLKKIASNWRHP